MDAHTEYERLMLQIRLAHQAFAAAWTEAQEAALKTISPRDEKRLFSLIWKANAIAYKVANPRSESLSQLLSTLYSVHLAPIVQGIQKGEAHAIEKAIDFLEIDVQAFRCGYAKETLLHKLKAAKLSDAHRERLRRYGIQLCSQPGYRREIREASRLMVLIADKQFVGELNALGRAKSPWVRKKASRMLSVVWNGREDLR